jgi:hypothetical protein
MFTVNRGHVNYLSLVNYTTEFSDYIHIYHTDAYDKLDISDMPLLISIETKKVFVFCCLSLEGRIQR